MGEQAGVEQEVGRETSWRFLNSVKPPRFGDCPSFDTKIEIQLDEHPHPR